MVSWPRLSIAPGLIIFSLLAGACADGGAECAQGTVEVDGECVPDGTVICGPGTIFNVGTGQCDPDPDGCGPGLVLDGTGTCVDPTGLWNPDINEPSEPNDLAGTPGNFTLPAVGNDTTLGGCVTPFQDTDFDGNLDADFDSFLFTITEPALIEVTVEGTGGLAGGFSVDSSEGTLQDDGYIRYGINLTGTTSQRQLYLPMAGSYRLTISDSRSFLVGPAGGDGACYLATVANLSVPEAQPLTLAASDAYSTETQFYRYDPQEAAILNSLLEASSNASLADLVLTVNGDYHDSAGANRNPGADSELTIAGLSDSDEVVFVVDPVYNYSLTSIEYTLTVLAPTVTIDDGSPLELVHNELAPTNLVAVPVEEDSLMRMRADTSGADYAISMYPATASNFEASNQRIADLCDDCDRVDTWIQVTNTGYYYLSITNRDAADGAPYTLSLIRNNTTPTALPLDSQITADLSTTDRAFFEYDGAQAIWPRFLTTITSGSAFDDVSVRFYRRTQRGQLDVFVPPYSDAGGLDFGRFYRGSAPTLLISIENSAGHQGDEVFDFLATERDYTDLGALDEDAPIADGGGALTTGQVGYYLVQVTPRDRIDIDINSSFGSDAALELLDTNESPTVVDNAGIDGLESYRVFTGSSLIAFAVRENASGDHDYQLSARSPIELEHVANMAIPDSDPSGISDVLRNEDACTVHDIKIGIDIEHSWRGDLAASLTSPTGIEVMLANTSSTNSSDDIVGTYPTTLSPAGSLNTLVGTDGAGNWTLRVSDNTASDVGTLNSWSIELRCN